MDEPTPDPSPAVPPEPDAPPAGDPAVLARERDDLYDRLLRTTAEFDNYRKRIERERREQANESVAQLLREILPVVDDFERALKIGRAHV